LQTNYYLILCSLRFNSELDEKFYGSKKESKESKEGKKGNQKGKEASLVPILIYQNRGSPTQGRDLHSQKTSEKSEVFCFSTYILYNVNMKENPFKNVVNKAKKVAKIAGLTATLVSSPLNEAVAQKENIQLKSQDGKTLVVSQGENDKKVKVTKVVDTVYSDNIGSTSGIRVKGYRIDGRSPEVIKQIVNHMGQKSENQKTPNQKNDSKTNNFTENINSEKEKRKETIEPIIVNDPEDPALKAYQDSLKLYKLSRKNWKTSGSDKPQTYGDDKYSKAPTRKLTEKEKKHYQSIVGTDESFLGPGPNSRGVKVSKDIYAGEGDVWPLLYNSKIAPDAMAGSPAHEYTINGKKYSIPANSDGFYSGEEKIPFMPLYKKPVQPVKYEKKLPKETIPDTLSKTPSTHKPLNIEQEVQPKENPSNSIKGEYSVDFPDRAGLKVIIDSKTNRPIFIEDKNGTRVPYDASVNWQLPKFKK
jgi:hypothetical protein